MTEKRFRVQEHCLMSSCGIEAENWLVTNDNHSVALNNKAEAHMVANMCNDVIDVFNALHEENQELRQDKTNLHRAMSRDRVRYLQFRDKVFDLIDEKIKHYEHKPFSAPVGQPMSVNFDADVDRIARLSELQDLKKELKMND